MTTDLWVSLSFQITQEVLFTPTSSFLDIILKIPTPKTRPQDHNPACWCLETRLDSIRLYAAPASFTTLVYNRFTRTTQKTHPLYCWEGVFTAPFHSNGSWSVVTCVFVAAGMCLPSRCLEINVYSDYYSGFRALFHNIYVYLHKFRVRSRHFRCYRSIV
jgi:hypothetical protein